METGNSIKRVEVRTTIRDSTGKIKSQTVEVHDQKKDERKDV